MIDQMSDPMTAGLPRSPGVWKLAWMRLQRDRVGVASLSVTVVFLVVVLLSSLGVLASSWQIEKAVPFAPPHFVGASAVVKAISKTDEGASVLDITDVDPLAPRYKEWRERTSKVATVVSDKSDTLLFGADRLGRSVVEKAVKGAQVSITVGITAALFATVIGTLLGAVGGYFGGAVDDLLEWIYNVFTSVPYILLVFALAALFKSGPLAKILSSGVWTIIIILSAVGWTGIYRLVRAEYIKHRLREYVRAAEAIGATHACRMFVHILPNISHVVLVQLSLHVVSFIKAEVILSFLGFGVPIDMVSWGTMLSEAQTELVLGKWWQLVAATLFMATFVTAFALLTDAMRDAMDPKLN